MRNLVLSITSLATLVCRIMSPLSRIRVITVRVVLSLLYENYDNTKISKLLNDGSTSDFKDSVIWPAA